MANEYKYDQNEMSSVFKQARSKKSQNISGSTNKNTSSRASSSTAASKKSKSTASQRKAAIKAKNKAAYQSKKKKAKTDINDGYSYSVDVSQRKAEIKKAQNRKNKTGLKAAIAIIIAIVILTGAALFVWYFFFSAGQDTFGRNITVDGISISGMTYAKAERALEEHETEIADSINITATANGKDFTITKNDLTYSFNTDEILNEAMEYSKQQRGVQSEKKEYTLKLTVDDSSYSSVSANIAKEVDKEAKNSTVTSWDPANLTFEVSESEDGFKVEQEEFTKALRSYISSGNLTGSIAVNSKVIEPTYSKDYISNNIYMVSDYTTVSTNTDAGDVNMATSLAACNGSIIEPGETWSFNTCTGDTNQTSNGYQEAGVIVNGKHEMGVGGGICQSSTTIYNAQLLAGLVVVERSCHYYKSSYVDAGLDATVDYGNIDLKMMNPFDYQIFLRCYMDGDTLHAEIYSLPNKNWDYIDVYSEITNYFDNGYDAETTREYYLNSELVDTEMLPSSRYYTSAPGGTTDDVSSYDAVNE